MILDLGDLKFCDSSGVALFVAANEKAKAVGTTLKLGNLNPAVSRVFGITGIDRVLDITEQDRPKPQVTSSISSRSASESFPPRRERIGVSRWRTRSCVARRRISRGMHSPNDVPVGP